MAMNDTSSPIISVIITTDVQDERLERTLASCINQSYGEFEIIVFVLREDVVSSIQTAVAHKHQIRYVSRKNSSENEARNDGLSQAVGDYIAFLSAGEELQSLWFEKAIKRFALSKVDAVQCATLYEQAQKTTGVHLPSDAFIGYYQRLLTDEQVQLSCAQFPPDKPLAGSWEFLIRTLQKRKVDVLPDYFGSIVHPYEDSRRHEKLKEYRKEQCEIMRTYYSRMRFSLRKVRQYFKIRRFCGR
jgi:glycosyltransferase involved in cell wall biosynthesis